MDFQSLSHAPKDYSCPICLGIQRIQSSKTLLHPKDILYQNECITIFINSFFIQGNEGHVIIVSNEHIETIYTLPEDIGQEVMKYASIVSRVIKLAYNCDGITVQQNNEPAGGQHAFHFHLHVFPRYNNDSFSQNVISKRETTQKERIEYVRKLQKFWKRVSIN
jgi:histidine triad (HIT) family protein